MLGASGFGVDLIGCEALLPLAVCCCRCSIDCPSSGDAVMVYPLLDSAVADSCYTTYSLKSEDGVVPAWAYWYCVQILCRVLMAFCFGAGPIWWHLGAAGCPMGFPD
ncbi:hypothetical protein Nepgr_021041 [Nepenthes gracilis]|uniref:Secreted protein n=1 Tax=Nepenthes gracilis TaxID=150966 RepID=A0AAD3XWV5_NEPGR|nr:hypothetical protein Nepgr_021041 [Nepenthes gracilis]